MRNLLNFKIIDSVPLVVYLLLATGTVLPFWSGNILIAFHTAFLIIYLYVVLLGTKNGKNFILGLIIIIPLTTVYLAAGIQSQDQQLLTTRIEGGLITTAILIVLLITYVKKYDELTFQKTFLKIGLIILCTTVLYKLQAGFFDRSVRFFINGPIVFGWLMSFMEITTMHLILQKRISVLYGYALLLCFILATLWTASKGPILGIMMVTIYLLFKNIRKKKTYVNIFLGASSFIALWSILPENFTRRFNAIGRIFNNSLEQQDIGSVGVRIQMWFESITIFNENLLFGVGVGNWQFNTDLGYLRYPHNIVMELAAETGLIGLVTYLVLIIFCFIKSSIWMRAVIILFCICTSLSGDFYYSRFVFAFPIAFIAIKSQNYFRLS